MTPTKKAKTDDDMSGPECSPVIASTPDTDAVDQSVLDMLHASSSDKDDTALLDLIAPDPAVLDLISPGYAIAQKNHEDDKAALDLLYHTVFQPSIMPDRPGWRPTLTGGYNRGYNKVHPAMVAPPARCPHHSQPQRVYVSARHVGAPSGAADIDSMRDAAPIRHRIVQRISADGRQLGPLKVERLVAKGRAMQHSGLASVYWPSTDMSGWCHLRFEKAADVVQDLQFALSPDTGIIVTSVAPGGLAQRNGVHPGFCVKAVNGDPHNLREQLLAVLSGDTAKPLELDLL